MNNNNTWSWYIVFILFELWNVMYYKLCWTIMERYQPIAVNRKLEYCNNIIYTYNDSFVKYFHQSEVFGRWHGIAERSIRGQIIMQQCRKQDRLILLSMLHTKHLGHIAKKVWLLQMIFHLVQIFHYSLRWMLELFSTNFRY